MSDSVQRFQTVKLKKNVWQINYEKSIQAAQGIIQLSTIGKLFGN